MIKPQSCQGCPLYRNGQGFVPDLINTPTPTISILCDIPSLESVNGLETIGYDEGEPIIRKVSPQPCLGYDGFVLHRTFLPYLQVPENEINFHHVLKCKYGANHDLPHEGILRKAVEHCTSNHLSLSPKSRTITQGELSFWFRSGQLTEPKDRRLKLDQWRGFLANQYTFATLDIHKFRKDMRQKSVAHYDWSRAYQWLQNKWPLNVPAFWIISPHTTEGEIDDWFAKAGNRTLYVDLEYVRDTRMLTLFGGGYRDEDGNFQGCQLRWADGQIPKHIKGAFVRAFRKYIETNTIACHNAFGADVPVLKSAWGIEFDEYHRIEDSMLAHALVESEYPHKLGFCASLYSQYDKMKHLMSSHFMEYNKGDVITGIETLERCYEVFNHNPKLWSVYNEQSLPVSYYLMESKEIGMAVDPIKVEEAFTRVEEYIKEIEEFAKTYCDLSLTSNQQMMAWLYGYENLLIKLGKTKKPCIDGDAILALRRQYCIKHDIELPEFDKEVWSPEYFHKRLDEGEHVLLICLSGYHYHNDKTCKYLKQLIIGGEE